MARGAYVDPCVRYATRYKTHTGKNEEVSPSRRLRPSTDSPSIEFRTRAADVTAWKCREPVHRRDLEAVSERWRGLACSLRCARTQADC